MARRFAIGSLLACLLGFGLAGCAARRPVRAQPKVGACQVQAVDPGGLPSEMSCRFGQSVSLWRQYR